ncbi:MAG: tetratricopeptide repeat protein [Cytophagales bacterium]|nr:tetratricopeptide repeat protein [Bernardetiaceae bacterium]MDW8203861.1 tetratricopeptide repeat protein [Cytophagales bacterium]
MKTLHYKPVLTFVLLLFFGCVGILPTLQAQKRADKDFSNAETAFKKEDYTHAITLLGKVISRHPDHLAAYQMRAESFIAIKDYNSAIADYTKAIEINPNDANLYAGRARAYRLAGNLQAALKDLDAALLLDKKENRNKDLLNHRAELNMQTHNYAAALLDYQELADLYPEEPRYLQARREALEKVSEEELTGLIELGSIRLASFGAGGLPTPIADDKNTVEVRKFIAEHTFTTLQEGRNYYYQLLARNDFAKGKKTVLLSLLREKILTDIFGQHPYMEDIEAMKRLVETEDWINPEGKKRYFQLINDSRYWFTGGVQRGDIYYFYKVMRSRYSSKYKMQMFAVVNNASNLVLNGEVLVSEDSLGNRIVEVPAVENKGYMWVTSKTDKLRGITNLQNSNLQFEPVGNINRFNSSAKGIVASQQYDKFIQPNGTDLNAAIKATLNYLILEYPKMFVMR